MTRFAQIAVLAFSALFLTSLVPQAEAQGGYHGHRRHHRHHHYRHHR